MKRFRPPPRLTANTVQARWLNQLRDCLESMTQVDAPYSRVLETTRGTSIIAQPKGKSAPGEPGIVQRLGVLQVWPDHIVCNRSSGAPGTVNVAKPWRLRQTPFHNKIINYTDEQGRTYDLLHEYLSPVRRKVTITTQGGITEFQVIVPRYNAGDYIFAATCDEDNGTGVIIGTEELELVDINADGRAWARER